MKNTISAIFMTACVTMAISTQVMAQMPGDIKTSFATADHNGWYLMDGRTVASLNDGIASKNATTLGITTLPDLSTEGSMLMGTADDKVLTISGNSTVSIKKGNLPNYNMTASSTATTATHSHKASFQGTGTSSGFQSGTFLRPTGYVNTNYGYKWSPWTMTSGSSGAHTHSVTFQSGGSGTGLYTTPLSMGCKTFIYLGKIKKLNNTIGELKYSVQKSDHNGWYVLDGRSISALSNVTAQANAQTLGLTTLVDATG